MAEYVKKEDIEQKIQDGLNNLVLGHDAIEVLGMLYEMPSEDVAKVRHGRWVYARTYYMADECNCSLCGQLMTTAVGKRMNYCPNCGAKMDLEN